MRAPALVLYILSSLRHKTASKGAGGGTSLGWPVGLGLSGLSHL